MSNNGLLCVLPKASSNASLTGGGAVPPIFATLTSVRKTKIASPGIGAAVLSKQSYIPGSLSVFLETAFLILFTPIYSSLPLKSLDIVGDKFRSSICWVIDGLPVYRPQIGNTQPDRR